MMLAPANLQLRDGRTIPQLGFGVWQVHEKLTEPVVDAALRTGFRYFDTAEAYYNEEGVGAALGKSGIARDAFFVSTKVWNTNHGYDRTLRAFDRSLERLGLEEVDLYLMHWPSQAQGLYVETWQALIEIHRQGRARSIGVSNFAIPHLDRIIQETGIVPVVNQIELHPRFQQRGLRQYHSRLGIITQSWSPLGQWKGANPPIQDPMMLAIAARHDRTPAQVVLRWHLEQGLVPLSKSIVPTRMAENFGLFDFHLTDEDHAVIAAMDDFHGRMGPDPEIAQF